MIRLRCGLNNNPNAIQFKGILRKFLVIKNGGVTPSLSSNCSILPVDNVSNDNSLSVDGEIMLDMEIFGSDNDFNNYLLQDQFNDHCLAYIAGYLITKVEKVVKGPVRRSALFSNPDDPLDLSLAYVGELRGKRAITIPSQSVFILIQTAENFFHSFIVQKLDTLSNESNLLEKVGQEILKVINYSTIFPSVNAQFSSVC
jgi:hypothetical protein